MKGKALTLFGQVMVSQSEQGIPCASSEPPSCVMPAGGSEGFATGGNIRSMAHYAAWGMRWQGYSEGEGNDELSPAAECGLERLIIVFLMIS